MANGSLGKLKKLSQDFISLFDERHAALHGERKLSRLRQSALFWRMVVESFIRNRCPVRASALAYTTLLAIVPLLAVGLGVSTKLLQSEGVKPAEIIVNKVVSEVAPQLGLIPQGDDGRAAREDVVRKITDFIAQIHSGALGVSGTIGLIATAILLLSTIEATLNDIWGVRRGRNWFASVIQYWAAITLGPLLGVLAIGLTVSGKFQTFQDKVGHIPMLGNLIFDFAPLVVLILVFTLFYQLMPNTKVHWEAALAGGLIGGVLWHLNSQFNVLFASKIVTASKIYGTLSAIPVVLVGLYFSWLIMLFGAQVSYAYQNRRTYLQEKRSELVNQRGREFVALRIMVRLAQHFQRGEPPPTAEQLAEALDVPTRLVIQIMAQLGAAQLAVEAAGGREPGYAPARPLEQITARAILNALRASNGQELETTGGPERDFVKHAFEGIRTAEEQAAELVTLAELARSGAGQRAG
jgi:membrane protein